MSDAPAQAARPLSKLIRQAVIAGVESAVRLHIKRGDDLEARDDSGYTPLMIAAARNRPAICRILLEAGVDHGAVGPCGRDALAIAIASGSAEAAEVLKVSVKDNGTCAIALTSSELGANDSTLAGFERIGASPLEGGNVTAVDALTQHAIVASSENRPAAVVAQDFDDESSDRAVWVDSGLWSPEEERAAPDNDASLVHAAVAVERAIREHVPVDRSEDWSDIELYLPERAAPIQLAGDIGTNAALRKLLLRAFREGSVPEAALEEVCDLGDDEESLRRERLLRLVINDLGAETDERFEYAGVDEDFRVFVRPDETPAEEDAIREALAALEALDSRRDEPIRYFLRDAQRNRLLKPEDEIALAQAMESALARAVEALAGWPTGLKTILAAAERVKSGLEPVSSISRVTIDETDEEEDSALHAPREALPDEEGQGEPESLPTYAGTSEERRDFLDKVARLAELDGAPESARDRIAVKATLSSFRFSPAFLHLIADSNLEDRSPPAQEFREAMTCHRKARDTFASANLRLVFSIARRYGRRGLPLDDLVQDGNVGLLRAIDKFDWRRGNRFSTMATWWIRQQVLRSLADTVHMIRLPVHVQDGIPLIMAEIEAYESEHGHAPRSTDLASRLSMKPSKLEAILRPTTTPLPIEELDAESGLEHLQIEGPEEAFDRIELREQLESVLATLDPKPQKIVRLRFGIGNDDALTLEEVGAYFEVTRERIRQIEAKAMEQLRHPRRSGSLKPWLSKDGPDPGAEIQFEQQPSDDGDAGSAESSDAGESSATGKQIAVAKPSKSHGGNGVQRSAASPKSPTDRLLEVARDMGLLVEDDRQAGGSVWILLVAPLNERQWKLVGELSDCGFEFVPGRGYRR